MRMLPYVFSRLMMMLAWSYIALCHRAAVISAFVATPPPPWSSTTTTLPTTTSTTALAATSGRQVRFDGASRTSVFVPFSILQNDNDRTLPAFLRSSDSNAVLLGTPNYKQRSDGMWDCPQPRIEWFGLDLSELYCVVGFMLYLCVLLCVWDRKKKRERLFVGGFTTLDGWNGRVKFLLGTNISIFYCTRHSSLLHLLLVAFLIIVSPFPSCFSPRLCQ
jgi:hypothetical protein